MATTAPASRSRHSSSAAAERVVPSFFARSGTRGSRSVQITSLPAGSRARVMPCATISESQRIGAPAARATRATAREAVAEHDVVGRFRAAARMDHAHHDISLVLGKARKVGLGADDGERALVDRIAVANIVVTAHREPPRARTSCTSCSGNASAVTEHDSTPSTNTSQRAVAAEHRHRRGGWMGAAFGAARNMDDFAIGQRRAPHQRSRARSRARQSRPTRRSARRRRRRLVGAGRRDRR